MMAATLAIFFVTYKQAGGDMTGGVITTLPPGVVALGGWANRLLVLAYSVWVMTVAWQAIKLPVQKP